MLPHLKLRAVIISVLVLGMFFPVMLAGWFTVHYQQNIIYSELEKEHTRIVDFLTLAMQEPIWTLVPETGVPLIEALMADSRILRIVVESDRGVFIDRLSTGSHNGEIITRTKKVQYYGKEIGAVTVDLKTSQLQEKIFSNFRQLQMIFLIPFCLSTIILFLVLRRKIITPLEILVDQSEALAGKHLENPFVWQRRDEIGLLGQSLEQTRKSLHILFSDLEEMNQQAVNHSRELVKTNSQIEQENQERRKAEEKLREYKHQLEETIKKRTAELTIANENLLTEIEERKKAEHERRRFELKLHQSEKMEVLGVLASGVAHDLNNILAGIASYPELLLLKLDNDSLMRQPLEAIHDAGKRAALVVADLLTIARDAATVLKPHNLNELVREYLVSPECLQLKNTYPKISIKFILDPESPKVLCSPVHVKKCLMNLIMNAAEASHKSGNITVEINNKGVLLESNEEIESLDTVTLSISDDGTGISEKDLKKIFEPFYSTKQMGMSGSGLGLAVVWNTMQEHKGKVSVESSDKGSRFDLVFQRAVSEDPLGSTSTSMEYIQGANETILIVDDEDLLLKLGYSMLFEMGYRVSTVTSGEEALEYLKYNYVDVVILDMMMEPGINGVETYRNILKLHPKQKAIIISGFSMNDEIREALDLGICVFLTKPYNMKQIGDAVQRTLLGNCM